MKQVQADNIVKNHVMWAMGGGLVPVPLLDLAAVTAVQIDMLKSLCDLYEVDFSQAMGKSFISALTGSTFAKLGASVVKAIPGIGTLLGGLSMSILSGASTYAVGQVAIAQLTNAEDFLNIDMDKAKAMYTEFFEKGKEYVSTLEKNKETTADILQTLEKMGQLREQGILTDKEFEAKKKELLARL
jgi:uncharacterized protein (DUF697 family)